MTKKTLTAKFTLMLIAVLVFVFAGVFCASVFSDGVSGGVNELNVVEAGSNTSNGTEYKLTAKGDNNILSGTNNASYWWDYQVGSYGGTSTASAYNSKYGWFYNEGGFRSAREGTQAAMIYLRLPSFMTTTKATISITLATLAQSDGPACTTYTYSNVASEIGKRTTSFSGSGLYWKSDDDRSGGLCNYNPEKSFSYSKTYENLGIGGCISVGIWSKFQMDGSGLSNRTRKCYCVITSFTVSLEGTYNTGTVAYNSNSGSGAISNLPITYGTDFSLSDGTGFSKDGYHFDGWNTAANGSGTRYTKGQSITDDKVGSIDLTTSTGGTTTLYAQWAINTLTISYHANGGSGDTTQTVTYNQAFTLKSSSGFSLASHTLIGWALSASDTVPDYNLSQSLSAADTKSGTFDLTAAAKHGTTVNLYAVWKESDFGKLSGASGVWGTQSNPYVIETATHLSNLYEIVNANREAVDSVQGNHYGNSISSSAAQASSITYAGCYFLVKADITANSDFAPIGKDTTNYFAGVIYGGSGAYTTGHTNRTITLELSGTDFIGLCGYITGTDGSPAGIEDLTIAGSVSGSNYVGGFAGWTGDFVNLKNLTNNAAVSGATLVGGITGSIQQWISPNHQTANGVTISNLTNTGAVSGTGTDVGGITGRMRGFTLSGNLTNSGQIGTSSRKAQRTGGISGYLQMMTITDPSASVFSNTGNIYGTAQTGGIVGQMDWCTTHILPSSTNSGTVNGYGSDIGGIIGYYYSYISAEKTFGALTNNGAIVLSGDGIGNVGGIIGKFTSNSTHLGNNKFTAPTNTGYINQAKNAANYVGGIFGSARAIDASNVAPVFSLSGETKNTGVVTGKNYVGGLFGYVTLAGDISTKLTNSVSVGTDTVGDGDAIRGTGYCYGGIAGYMDYIGTSRASITGKVTVTGNDVDGNGGGAVSGAFAGALVNVKLQPNTGSVFSVARFSRGTQSCTINGVAYASGGYAGGIVGIGDNIELNGTNYTGGNVISVGKSDYCGGIIAYAKNSTITNCSTNTKVGNNGAEGNKDSWLVKYTGGIAGYCTNTEISNCYYNGSGLGARGSSYTGGIVGWTDSSVSHCYNLGPITTNSTSNAGVGGIAGISSADISYCYNEGSVTNDLDLIRAGGIVGYSTGTLTYCYNKYVSVPVAGTNSTFSSMQKAWNIGTDKASTQANSKAYRFVASTVVPVSTNSVFTDILSENIQKLRATANTTNGVYLSITNDSDGYAEPSTLTNTTRNTDTTSFRGASNDAYSITAEYNFASTQTSVYVATAAITPSVATGSTKVYDKAAVSITATGTLVPSTYKQNSVEQNGKTVLNVGNYSVDVNILNPSQTVVLGTININYSITKKDISNKADQDRRIVFGYLGTATNNGSQYTIVSTSYNYYRLNSSYDTDPGSGLVKYKDTPAIVYSDSSYQNNDATKAKFAIFDGSTKLTFGTDYTIDSIPTLTGDEGIKKPASSTEGFVKLVGTGNYTGTYNVWFTLMKSDFDRLSTGTSGVWGTVNNPYVISAPEHMLRLTEIVSGKSKAWDSIVGVNEITEDSATATEKSYRNSYFQVSADITLTKTMGFRPVGTNDANKPSDTPFCAAEFDGDGHTFIITYEVPEADYVGVFAYVDGTNFKNINTAGTLSGNNYVGAVAGYLDGMLNGTFNNSASVTGSGDNVGGVVGQWIEYDQIAASVISGTNSGTIKGVNHVGGFAGCIIGADSSRNSLGGTNANVVFVEAVNNGAVTASNEYAGGITGRVDNEFTGATRGIKIYCTGCVNNASIKGKNYVGGITGYNRDGKFYGCVNGSNGTSSVISATGNYAGGIIGSGNFNNNIGPGVSYSSPLNINYMAVSGASYVGGIMGLNSGTSIANVENNGAVTASADYAGGIAGRYEIDGTTYTVTAATNKAAVTGKNYVGGIIGSTKEYKDSSEVTHYEYVCKFNSSENYGAVSGTGYVGGIIGRTVTAVAYAGTVINKGRITATASYAGGVAGYSDNSDIDGATLRNMAIIRGSSTSDYIGGLFGYLTLNKVAASGNFETYGTYGGRDYVGGIAGYISTNGYAVTGKFISSGTYGGTTYSTNGESTSSIGKFAGAVFGYSEGGSTVTFLSGTSVTGQMDAGESALTGSGSTASFIGSIAGANIDVVLDLTQAGNYLGSFSIINRSKSSATIGDIPFTNAVCAGTVAGFNSGTIKLSTTTALSTTYVGSTQGITGKYVGGIVGYNTGTIDGVNITLSTGVGRIDGSSYPSSYIGGIAGYNSGTISNFISLNVTRVDGGDYVGGFVGYNEGELSFSGITSSIPVSANGTTGYVGGFAGYTSGCITLKNFTQSGAVTSSGSYVGGIFGYAEDAVLKDISYAVSAISGVSYVGGIAGYINLQTSGTDINTWSLAASNGMDVTGTDSYVGTYAGYLSAETAGIITGFTPSTANAVNVSGKSYVGGIAGYFRGGGFVSQSNSTSTLVNITSSYKSKVSVSTTQEKVVGGLFGYVSNAGIVICIELNTSSLFNHNNYTLTTTASYVGGIVGILGRGAAIEWLSSDTTLTSKVIENGLEIISGGNYIGGIAGYVSAYAGALANGEYLLFNNINLKNSKAISGASYVGGIAGYIGDISSGYPEELDDAIRTDSIIVIMKPSVCYNSAAVTATGSYAGGLIGSVGDHIALNFENSPTADSSVVSALKIYNSGNVSAAYYCGGIAGFLSNNSHRLIYIINTGKVGADGDGSTYVGGFVGHAEQCSLENCVSASLTLDDIYNGAESVGGFVGKMDSGKIVNSYSLGYAFDKTTATTGGVVGSAGSSAELSTAWTFYLATNLNYDSNCANKNGKYVLADSDVTITPTFAEVCKMAGIYTGSADNWTNSSVSEISSKGIFFFRIDIGTSRLIDSPGHQLAFYEANGNDTIYSGIADAEYYGSATATVTGSGGSYVVSKNQVLFIGLGSTLNSVIIAVKPVYFYDIPQEAQGEYTQASNLTNFEDAYSAPSGFKHSSASNGYGTNVYSATYDEKGFIQYYAGSIALYLGSDRFDIGYFNEESSPGSTASPILIDDTNWNKYAYNIANNIDDNNGYRNCLLKLTKDITVTVKSDETKITENDYTLFGTSSHPFKGTFDGDGYTITVSWSNFTANSQGLFPYAAATIKHLTIKGSGTINTNGYHDLAAFVGNPSGNLTIEDCISSVNIEDTKAYNNSGASYNVGGFVGNATTGTVKLIDCVNTGNITTKKFTNPDVGLFQVTPNNVDYGTGGVIGRIGTEATVDINSCRNTGNIIAGHNVGGICGLSDKTITILNCANNGNVTAAAQANSEATSPNNAHSDSHLYSLSYSGGILGKLSGNQGQLTLMYSYNTGEITAYGNVSGGLVGGTGDLTLGAVGGSDSIKTGYSTILYCYNTGRVYSGGTEPGTTSVLLIGTTTLNGTNCGGIVGLFGSGIIAYTYNTGRVVSWRGCGYAGAGVHYQYRVGGIIGEFLPSSDSYIDSCYNVGEIEGQSKGYATGNGGGNNWGSDGRMYFGASIIGYIDEPLGDGGVSKYAHYSNCYSLKQGVHVRSENNNWVDLGNLSNSDRQSSYYSGTCVQLEDLTAAYNSSGKLALGSNITFSNKGAASLTSTGSVPTTVQGVSSGYIYVYGCLPQLAVFALDTKESLSMLSKTYGRDSYGRFVAEATTAGAKESPYIIKDGIDLLNLSALTNADTPYNLSGKYIETANSLNNLDKVVSSTIDLSDFKNGSDNEGKSYHLYRQGAVCSTAVHYTTDTSQPLNNWKSKNYNQNNQNNIAISAINFYPIGMNGGNERFSGSISGKQADGSNSVITGLKMTLNKATCYAGLFGFIQDAAVSYLTVDGQITANASSEISAGMIVGFAAGKSVIDNCVAGSQNSTSLTATASAGANTYVGGIVGKASTVYYSGNTLTSTAGYELNISNCTTNINVTTPKNNAGGILGAAVGKVGNCTVSDGKVIVSGCKVHNSTITAATTASNDSDYGTLIGGIAGSADANIGLTISGCSVGTDNVKTVISPTVTISGENRVGGLVGFTSVGDAIGTPGTVNSVYGDVLILRASGWGNQNNYSLNGTEIGTAVGGIVGCTDEGTSTTAFAGTNNFYGSINVASGSSVFAVGGIVGYLAKGAVFNPGSIINIYGQLNIPTSIETQYGFGGVAGIAHSASFNGDYTVGIVINAQNANDVGGFIGDVSGNVSIASTSANTNINIETSIEAVDNVGGFVGHIEDSAQLEIKSEGSSKVVINIENTASITSSNGNVGGIIGLNDGLFNALSGDITNNGTIIGGSSLPDGYTALEYITTDGSAYIATGFMETNRTTVNCDVEISAVKNYLFGSQQNSGSMMYNGLYNNQTLEYNWLPINYPAANRIKMTQTLSGNNMIYDINGKTGSAAVGTSNHGEFYIFGCRYNSGSSRPYGSSMTLYSFSIADDGITVRNFIPCKNSDDVVGLYDTVTGAFYTNAGSGSFTAGPEITATVDNAGGFVGNNQGNITLVSPVITNSGAVSGRNNIGGFIGYNSGDINLEEPVITNSGTVLGNTNVGGVIGRLENGTLSGTFENSGAVTGNFLVGGSIGSAEVNAVLTVYGTEETLFENSGNVTGYQYVGGSVGGFAGTISGTAANTVRFVNRGTVSTADAATAGYIGGSFGVLAGKADYASFDNAGIIDSDGVTSIGGSIGLIGLPVTFAGTSHNDIEITNCHFEFTSESGINVGPDAYDSNNEGGVGGIIGVLYNVGKFNETNSFFVLGSVHAPYLDYVGGSIGVIHGGNAITINGLLAYKSTVEGYQNVGGIIGGIRNNSGVTISNSYNVSIGGQGGVVANIAKGKEYGGIVGLSPDTTEADTSYWVKGFPNEQLATLNINNVKNVGHYDVNVVVETFSGHYSPAGDVYISYKDGITYYEQRETYAEASGVTSSNYIYYYIKTGENTYTEAGGASSSYNSETTYYEKTYEYSVASGVSASNYRNYYVDRYELTSSYVDSHVIDEYLAATGQQALATSVTSWEEYISARYPAKVDAMTIYLDGNRNWVEMVEDGEAYTTGIKSTGYYFLYANDTGISVSHEESPAGTYPTGTYTKFDVSDIDFWKRIANSYTTAEIEAGKNTDAIRSEIAPDLYPIGATKTDVQTVKAGGEVESRHLYARAASNYRDGFFLYMKSSTNEGIDPYHDTNTNSTDFFVTVDLEQGPQNVVLFYRSVEMGSSLTYNGNERFAPITLNSDEIGYVETVSNVLDDSKVSKYYYTVKAGSSGIDGKTPAYKATDVGNYVADIVLYYYDATGHPYEVGSIINGEWSITPRQLKMTAKQKGVAVYNGTATTGDVEVAIDNFCVADEGNATIQIVFTADETSILKDEFVFTYQLGTQISPSVGHATPKYISPKGTVELTSKSMSGNAETGYNLKENAENKTYSAKLNFTFTNALKYTVTVNTFAGIAGHETLVKDYIVPEVEAEVEVQARTLHVGDTSTDTSGNNISALSKQYNGAPFTKDIFITGWAASDSNEVNRGKWFMDFFPYWTDENGNVTYFKLSTNGGSSTDSTKSLVTDSNGSYVTIQGENKGTYNFGFNSSKSTSGTPGTSTGFLYTTDGNYKIQISPNPQPALVIAENALTLTWSGANKTYNGSGITVTATIKSTYDLADTSTWNTLLSTYLFAMASKTANNVKENACVVSELLPQSKDECKITFTTNKNADTYVAKITGPDQAHINANCPLTTTTSGTESSRSIWTDEVTISKKALTVNYTQEGVSPYIYNTSHQGVTLVYLTGFVSSENIENTGSYGKENGTQINETSGISSTYSKSDNGYTITGGAVNVGTYSVGIRISAANSNYSVSTANKEWKIDKYEITLGTGGTTTSVYNGKIQSIEAVYNDPNLKPGSTTAKRKYYTDEVEISFLYATSGGKSANDVCNVGTYTITINSVNAVSAKDKSGNNVSFNYSVKDSTAYTATHTITPVAVSVTFSAPSTFVYNTKEQGPVIATATITTATGDVTRSATAAADFKSAKFAGLYGTEEITVTVTNSGNKDANTYRATATSITASGNNEAGLTNTANYTFTTATKDYEIQKSKIKVTIDLENVSAITKVYDRTTSAFVDSTAFTLSSVNGGAALPASALSDNSGTANPQPGMIYGTYDTKDVGTGKTVTFSVKNTSVQNYIFENDSNEYSGLEIKTGVITRAAVVISMNLSRNKAVKTYDGTNEYAVFENGNANNRSVKYKSGQGFTVSGVLAGDDLIISAEFREADKSRSYFDAFINNVTREGSEGSYTYSKTTDTYKCLVFTVTSSSGNDFMNYSVMIDRFTSLQPITSSSNEANAIYLYDSRDSDASHKNADTSSVIGIEISAKTITATYENTTQSYANDDNSFNMMWKAVTGDSSGIITGDGVTFAMINGWMYENGADRHANTPGVDITQEEIDAGIVKKYTRYTTVRGTSLSTSLRATLVSTNGKHLNYVLRQQPTLTIGYFVNQDGYEINSFAGLMLATYYYSTNFMETSLADDDINTATLVNTWNLIKNSTGATCSWEDYENNVNIPTDLGSCTTWDDYFDKFITKYNKDITDEQLKIEEIIYEDGSATGAAAGWGYWVNVKQARTSYLKFKQTKNITAVLSDNDIAILNGQFGSDWGLGTQYLSNFIKCSAGEVCVAVNAVFPVIKVDSRYYGFLGEYYGYGFVIDNLTIMANNASSFSYGSGSLYTAPQYGEVTGGIGMFALVNSSPLPSFSTISGTQNGYVTAVNIRNAVITVSDLRGGAASDVLYAGGLIGVSQMTGTLVNSSFHGTIVASSSGAGLTVGGLIGLYSQPSSDIAEIVKGSIISGAVHVYGKTNVETGALIGRVNGTSTNAVIADIVSVSEIIATVTSDTANYIGALVGYAGNVSSSFVSSVSNIIAYLTNSTLKVVGNSESLLNKAVGSASADSYGVSYTTLRSGTNTAYNASGVFDPVSMPSGGTYDVMDKAVVLGTNDLISTRLGDIIDIYVLLFTLSEGSRTDGTNTIPVTTKLSTSPLTGKKLGTATSRIPVNNQQQAALLRMVPFAEFELKSNVKMYSTHKAEPYNGFFHGTITGSYTIDLIYATSSANAGKMFRWVSGTSLPCISTVPEETQS